MTALDLYELMASPPSGLRSRTQVLFLVTTLPPDTAPGDKLPIVAFYDADGSLVIEVKGQVDA